MDDEKAVSVIPAPTSQAVALAQAPAPAATAPPERITGGKGGWIAPIRTSERARELAAKATAARERNRQIARRAALEGLLAGVQRVSPEKVSRWDQAWAELVGVQSEKAVGGDTSAFTAVGRAGSLFELERGRGRAAEAAAAGMAAEDAAALGRLLAAFREWEGRPENAERVELALADGE